MWLDCNLIGHQWTTKSCRVGPNYRWRRDVTLDFEGVVDFGFRFSFHKLLLYDLPLVNQFPAYRAGQITFHLLSKFLELVEAFFVEHVSLVACKDHHLVARLKLKRADRAK